MEDGARKGGFLRGVLHPDEMWKMVREREGYLHPDEMWKMVREREGS